MKLQLLVLCVFVTVASAKYTCPRPGIPKPTCPELPTPPPATDVRHLRPGNIKVVAALGDSMTAGFGAVGIEPLEWRGVVYSTGADLDDEHTIHNYLKHYTKDLEGGCRGSTIPLTKKGKGLNTAVSGARIEDVPAQIDVMLGLLNTTYKHVQNEWKLITLFIGANNLCGACDPNRQYDHAAAFEKQLRLILDKIRLNIPKSFVNVMEIFNVSQVWNDSLTNGYCRRAVPTLHECGCLNANATDRAAMDAFSPVYNEINRRVTAEYAARMDPEFTAVSQPCVRDMMFATFGEDFLSDIDCFHPSLCAHQSFALLLWNNMFQKVGQKDSGATVNPKAPPPHYCPTANDYIQ